MKEFENIGKKMPYQESPEYLNQLIERTTETAIRQSQRPQCKVRPLLRYVAAAAVAVLLIFAGISIWYPATEQQPLAQTESPVDDFLNNISDEEVQLLAYYDIDDVPEYE